MLKKTGNNKGGDADTEEDRLRANIVGFRFRETLILRMTHCLARLESTDGSNGHGAHWDALPASIPFRIAPGSNKIRLIQESLAQRAGVSRTTVARMETLAKGDMSVSALLRLLEAADYDLKPVKQGHARTIEDILAEQHRSDGP